jgi:hypothetical protein
MLPKCPIQSFLPGSTSSLPLFVIPEARLISCWKDKVLIQNYFKFDEHSYELMKDFDRFVVWVATQDVTNCDEHLMAQHALIDLNNLDYLGRFEYFNDDFKVIANKIGVAFDPNKSLNKSKVNKSFEPSDKAAGLLREVYFKDFQLFYPEMLH